jgi:hypothetical protein
MTKAMLVGIADKLNSHDIVLDPFAGVDDFGIPQQQLLNLDGVKGLPETAKVPVVLSAIVTIIKGEVYLVKSSRTKEWREVPPGAVWYVKVRISLPGCNSGMMYMLAETYFILPEF